MNESVHVRNNALGTSTYTCEIYETIATDPSRSVNSRRGFGEWTRKERVAVIITGSRARHIFSRGEMTRWKKPRISFFTLIYLLLLLIHYIPSVCLRRISSSERGLTSKRGHNAAVHLRTFTCHYPIR